MKPLEKLQAIVDAATPGPFHVGHIDENLEHAEIESKDGIPIAEVYGRANQNFFCAAGNVLPALIAVVRLLYSVKGCRVEMAGGKEWLHIPMFYLDEIRDALAALDKAIEGG